MTNRGNRTPKRRLQPGDPLTTRQREIFDFIVAHIRSHSYPPTTREIMAHMRVKGPNGARGHLKSLEAKGVIAMDTEHARGIRILVGKVCPNCGGLGRCLDD